MTLATFPDRHFVLLMDNKDLTFQTFTWTEVDYGFAAVVTYTVQMDKKANNFSSPIDLVTVSNATTGTITVGELNKLLLAAGLSPDAAADVQFRVKSTIHTAVPAVYSDITEASSHSLCRCLPAHLYDRSSNRRMELGHVHI